MNFIADKHFQEILSINTARELHEELAFDEKATGNLEAIGLINDDESEVGKVHIGILSTLEFAEDAQVEVKEKEQIAGRWIPITDLKDPEIYERFETWSQFVADILVKEVSV